MDTLDEMLHTIHVPYPARRVYLDLVEHGESPARSISERLSMTRPSVYDQLDVLASHGLLSEREVDGKAFFAVDDIDELPRLLNERIDSIKKLTDTFSKERATLQKKTQTVEPKIKFFEGREGLVRLYRDLLWESDTTIETLWPHTEMAEILGEKEIESFNKKRIKRHVKIHSIWPCGSRPKRGFWAGGDWGVERRIAPRGFSWSMQYTIYGDKVAFMSSEDELFGFVVLSREFAFLMHIQFKALWLLSK